MWVFPKGASTLCVRGQQLVSLAPATSYHERELMKKIVAEANYAYIVEVTNQQGEHLTFFAIQQCIPDVHKQGARDTNAAAVNRELNRLHKKTGCNYGVVWEGPHLGLEARIRLMRKLEG